MNGIVLQEVLDNGTEVVVDPIDGMQTVAMRATFHTGCGHETEADHGLAHFVEHMMFKGDPSTSSTLIQQQLAQLGCYMNAQTERDTTSFNILALRETVDEALRILAGMLVAPEFKADDFEIERKIVLEELRGSGGNNQVMREGFYGCAYGDHPMTRPIIGSEDSIESFTLQQVTGFGRRHYVSGNFTVAVAGSVDPIVTRDAIKHHFGAMPAGQRAKASPVIYSGGEAHFPCSCEHGRIMLGFPVDGRSDKDEAVSEIMTTLIGGGPASRLFVEVREKRGLAYDVSAYNDRALSQNLLVLEANGQAKTNKEMFKVILDVLLAAQSDITNDDVQQVKMGVLSRARMEHDMVPQRADYADWCMQNGHPVRTLDARLLTISSVTADDVKAAIGSLLQNTPSLAVHGNVRRMPVLADYYAQSGITKAA